MSIKITQTCDKCGAERQLQVGYHGGLPDIKRAALNGGWRDVTEWKHLCDKCIREVVGSGQ